MSGNPLPDPDTADLEAAERPPTHKQTQVDDLKAKRQDVAHDMQEASVDTSLQVRILSIIDTALDLAT